MTTGDSVNGRGVEVDDRRYVAKEKCSWLVTIYKNDQVDRHMRSHDSQLQLAK